MVCQVGRNYNYKMERRLKIKKDLTADAHQRMRARLEAAGCSPDLMNESALAVKRALDRNLNSERYVVHRNYVPDTGPTASACSTTFLKPVAVISVRASRNEGCVEALRNAGYLVCVCSSGDDDERQTTDEEEAEFAAVLADYSERVPNGSKPWHAKRGSANEKPVFDNGLFGVPDEEVPIEELSDEEAYERIVKERHDAYESGLEIDLGYGE